MSLDKENMKKICLLIVFTLAVFVGLWRLDVVISAITFLGGILAPFINRIEITICKLCSKDINEKRQKKREKFLRPFSMILTLVFVIAVLALAVLVIFPELGRTVSGLGRTIQANVPVLLDKLEELFHNNKEISYWLSNLDLNWDEIIRKATNIFQSGADIILGSTFSVVQSIFSGVTTFVIGFVFACYILIQKEKLGRQCRKLLFAYLKKQQAERVLEIASLTHRTFAKFLTGQCLEAVILGTMFFVAMTLLRFPYALLVGVLIAITALIPIFGAFIGCVVAAFLILMVSPMQALAFIVLFLVLQQLEGNFIYPHVVGGSVGLPSIWVLVAVTVGGSLMGIVGMLIFIPLMSVLYTLLRQDVVKRLEKKQLDIS